MTNKEVNNKKRNLIIVGILLLLLLCVSLGSAYLSQMLQINGTTNIGKSSWSIYFDNEAEQTGSVSPREPLTIDTSKKLITFGVTFTKPGEFYEFEVDTVNDGAMDAMVNRVVTSGLDEENKKYINFEATYNDGSPINQYDLLAKNTRERIKVRVEFKEVDNKEDLPPSDLALNLEFRIEYIQSDETAHERDKVVQNPAVVKASFLVGGPIGSVTTKVKRIIFDDHINTPEDAIATADFSEAQDGRVIAYTVPNAEDSTKYDLHIEGDGSLYANPDSSWAFVPYSYVEEIIGGNKLNTSLVTNMSYMFSDSRSLVSIDDTSNWDLSNVTNMKNAFQGTTALKLIGGSGNWNLNKVTDMSSAFQNTGIEYLEANNWGLENLTDMSNAFRNATSLISLGEELNWNLSNVENMSYAFSLCTKLVSIDASNWGLNKVKNMNSTFYEDTSLTTLGDTSGWHFEQIETMSYTFYSCNALTSLDASNWGLETVTSMVQTFMNCHALTTLGDTRNWNLNKVTDINNLFAEDRSLTTIGDTANWGLTNVTNMKGTFANCPKLESLKTTHWNTAKVSNFQQTFMGLESITDFDISNIDFNSATNTDRMFADSPNISGTLNFNGTKVTNYSNMFTVKPRIDDPNFERTNQIIVNYIEGNETLVENIMKASLFGNTIKGTLIS